MVNSERFMMFNLAFWDVGKLASIKYDYIQPVRIFIQILILIFSLNFLIL